MRSPSMEKVKQFFKKPFLYLAITILGCALKFTHLDTRLFWLDEISTVMHTSGIVLADPSRLPVNEIRHISFYDSLLRMNTQPYTIAGQLYGLAADVHLTPGHYAFLIFWQRIVGDSPSDYRLFSVFIFIITLPVLFLFIKELYQSDLAGWIALSLYAVSPFIHLYARDARYYILWSFFFILSNWLILKSIKHNSSKWWIAYSITAVLTLYTSVLSALFVAGHFLYVLVFRRDLLLKYSTCLFLTGLF